MSLLPEPSTAALRVRVGFPASTRRRSTRERMAAYRAFGEDLGWPVFGLHQDLSYRYPVPPLLGAVSAQAEIALNGEWNRWRAVVASVLVRSVASRTGRGMQDTVVQLTVFDTGPLGVQFAARRGSARTEVCVLGREAEPHEGAIAALLHMQVEQGRLLPGDHIGTHELGLVHTRLVRPGRRFDIEAPLHLLAGLAAAAPAPFEEQSHVLGDGRPALHFPASS